MSTYYPPGQQGGLWLQRQARVMEIGLIPDFSLRRWSHPHFVFSEPNLLRCSSSFFFLMVHLFSRCLITREPQLVNRKSQDSGIAWLPDGFFGEADSLPGWRITGKRSDFSSCNVCAPCHNFSTLWGHMKKQLSVSPGSSFPWVQFVNAQLFRDEKLLGVRHQHQCRNTLQSRSFGPCSWNTHS